MSRCPSCHGEVPPDSRFCPACGAPAADGATPPSLEDAATEIDPVDLFSDNVHDLDMMASVQAKVKELLTSK